MHKLFSVALLCLVAGKVCLLVGFFSLYSSKVSDL